MACAPAEREGLNQQHIINTFKINFGVEVVQIVAALTPTSAQSHREEQMVPLFLCSALKLWEQWSFFWTKKETVHNLLWEEAKGSCFILHRSNFIKTFIYVYQNRHKGLLLSVKSSMGFLETFS